MTYQSIDFNKLECILECESETEFYEHIKELLEPGDYMTLEVADIPTPDCYVIDSSNIGTHDHLNFFREHRVTGPIEDDKIRLQVFDYWYFPGKFDLDEMKKMVEGNVYLGGYVAMTYIGNKTGKNLVGVHMLFTAKKGVKPASRDS